METIERLRRALVDRYRVERELGRGGMAVVYLARDVKHGRRVALKVLRPDVAAAVGAERFHREIEIAAGLNHPNVLALHDSGEADGLLFFVMPFVEGESLRARLTREKALPLADATRIVRQVGGALHYAHRNGLVHRDVKPENVLFQEGHALVCDFGIARAMGPAHDRLTRTGTAVGTIAYMSPEQLTDGGVVDARADVYALGCLLHEMLTGAPPFQASTPQAAYARKLGGDVSELETVRADVPPTVRAVVRDALAVEPDDRFATAESLVDALVHATTDMAIEQDARRTRRRAVLRRIGVIAAAGAIGGAAWGLGTLTGGPTVDRIAVLPVRRAGTAPEREFFVQTVSQDLAWELARARFRVTSPSSSARYDDGSTPVRAIADSLAVDGILQVQAVTAGGQVEIDVALVDGRTEEILWADVFSGPERHVLSLYGAMTRALADEIGFDLTDAEVTRLDAAPEVDPQVFEALRAARYELNKLTEEGIRTAESYYRLALELSDSTSAEAWAGLAQTWPVRAQQGLMPAEEAIRRSEPALARARDLDPGMAEIQAQLALLRTWSDWDWQGGEQAFRNALDRMPADATTRAYYALLLAYRGRDDEAASQMDRAAQQDPYNTLLQGLRGQLLNAQHRYTDARRVLEEALGRDPDAPFLLSTLRTTHHLLGDHDAALESWRASFTPEGSYSAQGDAEAAAALERGVETGGYRAGLHAVAELYIDRSREEEVSLWGIATLLLRAGDEDRALDFLEMAFEAHNPNLPYISIDPIFDPIRDEPRFQALVDQLGLPG